MSYLHFLQRRINRDFHSFNILKTLIIIFCIAAGAEPASAEVSWLIQGGGMYRKQYGTGKIWDYNDNGDEVPVKGNAGEGLIGLYLRIPVSKRIPMYIETGLGYRTKVVISQAEGYKFEPIDLTSSKPSVYDNFDYYYGNFIELPVKVGYELPLKGKNSILFGVGPTVSWCGEKGKGEPWTVGLNASVTFKHRALNVGLSYSNPLFYNGLRDYYKNSLNVTIGISFGCKIWNKIGNGVIAASSVMGVVSEAYLNSQGTYPNNTIESTRESASYEYSSSDSSSSTKSGNDKNKYSIAEQNNYNTDKRTYGNYESMLIKAFLYPEKHKFAEVKDWQSKMKKLREKWEKQGKSFPRSEYENKTFNKK